MHKEFIATDSRTPLHLIREKELEISGRVLLAKREADEIVSGSQDRCRAISRAEAEGRATPR